jgi:hypothetical protein
MARVMEDGIELFNIAKSAGHRYRYRGSEHSQPWGLPGCALLSAGAAARSAPAARVRLRSCSWGRGGWAGSRFLLRLVT